MFLFSSKARNLIDADLTSNTNVYVHDVVACETRLLTVDSNGWQPYRVSSQGACEGGICADGQIAVFDTVALLAADDPDTDRSTDRSTYRCTYRCTYVHDRSIPAPRPFCFGTATACPCGKAGALGFGCRSGNVEVGVRLISAGAVSVANDTLFFEALVLPTGASVLFFQGNARVNGGLGAPFGDRLRCAGGTTMRLGVKVASNGFAGYGPVFGDVPVSTRGGVPPSGGTDHDQAWFRDPSNFCTPATYNLSSELTILWIP